MSNILNADIDEVKGFFFFFFDSTDIALTQLKVLITPLNWVLGSNNIPSSLDRTDFSLSWICRMIFSFS